jgi:hypothetical protein
MHRSPTRSVGTLEHAVPQCISWTVPQKKKKHTHLLLHRQSSRVPIMHRSPTRSVGTLEHAVPQCISWTVTQKEKNTHTCSCTDQVHTCPSCSGHSRGQWRRWRAQCDGACLGSETPPRCWKPDNRWGPYALFCNGYRSFG